MGLKPSSVESQSQLLQDSLLYIHEEYKRIAEKGGVWGQVEYEWFSSVFGNSSTGTTSKSNDDKNTGNVAARCVALVTALIEFIGWGECDIADACSRIEGMKFAEKSTGTSVGQVKNLRVDGSDTLLIPSIPYKVEIARS